MNRKTFQLSAVAAAVLATLVGGYAAIDTPLFGHAHAGAAPGIAATVPEAPKPAALPAAAPAVVAAPAVAAVTDFSGIVDRYGPAVVNISVTGKAKPADAGFPGVDPNDPFFEFFRRFGPGFPRPPANGPVLRGNGSGFIVSGDGVILTNAHVVDGADEVTVKLTDRREFRAKVLGADRQTDVAVLKIEARDLPTVRLGDPAATRVGEPVLAIGSPFGFENSATSGIVSAKSRSLPDGTYVPFIQTDVAVNPGNSGGPLFNARGEVIGINSQIYSRTGGYQGLSFAIPIDVANHVQAQLVKHGKVTRGRLGVTIQEVNQALADSFGLKAPQGALVSSVEKGSAAERAGVAVGDIIVRFNGKEIRRSADLPALVAEAAPGTAATLEVVRNGSPKTLNVSVGEAKVEKVADNDRGPSDQGRLGLAVRPLDRDEQRAAGVNGGLVVEGVNGPAARAGIQPGDILLALNGQPVTTVDQLRRLADKVDKRVAVLVQRGGDKIFVPLQIG